MIDVKEKVLRKFYKVWSCECVSMLPGDPKVSPDEFFSFVFVLDVSGRTKRQEVRDKGRGARGEEVLRGLFASVERDKIKEIGNRKGLGCRRDADYADYADFEMCFDCSMQNLDAFGVEDFVWKVFGLEVGVETNENVKIRGNCYA
jgi:hypothetical protein